MEQMDITATENIDESTMRWADAVSGTESEEQQEKTQQNEEIGGEVEEGEGDDKADTNEEDQEKQQLARSGLPLYRTSDMCRFFNTKRGCQKGDNCDFSHVRFTCAFYVTDQGCNFGDNCSCVHEDGNTLSAKLKMCPNENCDRLCAGRQCIDCHNGMEREGLSRRQGNNTFQSRRDNDRGYEKRPRRGAGRGRRQDQGAQDHGRDQDWGRRQDQGTQDHARNQGWGCQRGKGRRRNSPRFNPMENRRPQRDVIDHLKMCSSRDCHNTTLGRLCDSCNFSRDR